MGGGGASQRAVSTPPRDRKHAHPIARTSSAGSVGIEAPVGSRLSGVHSARAIRWIVQGQSVCVTPTPTPCRMYHWVLHSPAPPLLPARPATRALFNNSAPLRGGGGGGPTPPTHLPWSPPPPLRYWAKFPFGTSADQKVSLASLAPIGLDQKFFSSAPSAPLKPQHHRRGGGGAGLA